MDGDDFEFVGGFGFDPKSVVQRSIPIPTPHNCTNDHSRYRTRSSGQTPSRSSSASSSLRSDRTTYSPAPSPTSSPPISVSASPSPPVSRTTSLDSLDPIFRVSTEALDLEGPHAAAKPLSISPARLASVCSSSSSKPSSPKPRERFSCSPVVVPYAPASDAMSSRDGRTGTTPPQTCRTRATAFYYKAILSDGASRYGDYRFETHPSHENWLLDIKKPLEPGRWGFHLAPTLDGTFFSYPLEGKAGRHPWGSQPAKPPRYFAVEALGRVVFDDDLMATLIERRYCSQGVRFVKEIEPQTVAIAWSTWLKKQADQQRPQHRRAGNAGPSLE